MVGTVVGAVVGTVVGAVVGTVVGAVVGAPVRVLLTLVASALAALPTAARAHPLHSTMTEVVHDAARGTVRATIRVFASDLDAAVRRTAGGAGAARAPGAGPAWELAALAYTRAHFGVLAGGRALALAGCGMRRTGDVLWLCVEGRTAAGAGALAVRNLMLCELFDDQINVVQGTIGGARRSLLFVGGSGTKPLT